MLQSFSSDDLWFFSRSFYFFSLFYVLLCGVVSHRNMIFLFLKRHCTHLIKKIFYVSIVCQIFLICFRVPDFNLIFSVPKKNACSTTKIIMKKNIECFRKSDFIFVPFVSFLHFFILTFALLFPLAILCLLAVKFRLALLP